MSWSLRAGGPMATVPGIVGLHVGPRHPEKDEGVEGVLFLLCFLCV